MFIVVLYCGCVKSQIDETSHADTYKNIPVEVTGIPYSFNDINGNPHIDYLIDAEYTMISTSHLSQFINFKIDKFIYDFKSDGSLILSALYSYDQTSDGVHEWKLEPSYHQHYPGLNCSLDRYDDIAISQAKLNEMKKDPSLKKVYDILLSVAEDMHYDYSRRVGMSVTFADGPALLGDCNDYTSLLIQRLREANIAGVSAITKVTGYPNHLWVTLQYNGELLYLDPTWFDTDDIDENVRIARPLYRDARDMTFDNAIFTNYGEHHIPGILYKEGDNDRVIAVYTEAIRLDPNAIAYEFRGSAYYQKGDYDRAIAEYTEAIRLDPNYAIAYLDRGNVYYHKGDYDRAIADFTEAIRLYPNAIAYTARGCAYDRKGDNDRAIADYTEAIRLDPDYAIAYANRGITNKQLGQIDLAIQDFEKALSMDPNLDAVKEELRELRGN